MIKSDYKKLLQFKDFGRPFGGSDDYQILGFNFKFTDLQAVFGIEQMKKMEWRVERKKEIYKLYFQLLKEIKQVELIETDLSETSPWFIDILVPNPDKLSGYLKEQGIGTRRFYPILHNLPFYKMKITLGKILTSKIKSWYFDLIIKINWRYRIKIINLFRKIIISY